MGCGKRDQGCIPCWQPNFSGKRAAGNGSAGMAPQAAGGVQWSWCEPEADCAAEGRAEALAGPLEPRL